MNFIVEEIIRTDKHESFRLVHPFNDYECALKTVKLCSDQQSETDSLSFIAINNDGQTFDLPIV